MCVGNQGTEMQQVLPLLHISVAHRRAVHARLAVQDRLGAGRRPGLLWAGSAPVVVCVPGSSGVVL